MDRHQNYLKWVADWDDWEQASGRLKVGEARKLAAERLIPVMCAVVERAWAEELPICQMPRARRQVGAGVRQAIAALTLHVGNPKASFRWGDNFMAGYGVEDYWEPAEPSVPVPDFQPAKLQAYRWAAAILSGYVRNKLEDLHARHTSDAGMPALNRGNRNAAYDVLLTTDGLGYHLARWPYRLLGLATVGEPVRVPMAAG